VDKIIHTYVAFWRLSSRPLRATEQIFRSVRRDLEISVAHEDNIRHVLFRIVAYVLQETGMNAAENVTKGRHPVPGSILNQTSRNTVTIPLLSPAPFLVQAFFYKLISESP
jgi:hypothetical protein